MDDYILISNLNDFIFCPYSIYLHNVYMDADEDVYHAAPQTIGKAAHESVDMKTYSSCKNEILALPVYSDELGIMGKIDLYKVNEKKLIERKYQLKHIYQGQIYQLWAQFFCMTEMGYAIDSLSFYEISTNKMHPISIPDTENKNELLRFIDSFRHYNPEEALVTSPNKCIHCIYCNLCDKTDTENGYS